MSWGSTGTAIAGAFKQGLKKQEQQGLQGGSAPQQPMYPTPAPAAAPQQDTPGSAPIKVGGQQPAPSMMQSTPLLQLLSAIWKPTRNPGAAPGGPAPRGYVNTSGPAPDTNQEGDGY